MNQIILGDCLDVLSTFDDNIVDLVVIDPPYYNVCKEEWDLFTSKEEYLNWCHKWSDEAFRVLKDGGSFYVFGGVGSKNGFIFWNYVEQLSEKYTHASYINWKRFRPKGLKAVDAKIGKSWKIVKQK